MTKYAYMGRHPESLANGRPVAHGEVIKLSAAEAKHEHNRRLIDSGSLVEQISSARVGDAKTAEKTAEKAAAADTTTNTNQDGDSE